MIGTLAAIDRGKARDAAFDFVFVDDVRLAQAALRAYHPGVIRYFDNQVTAILRRVTTWTTIVRQ